MAGKGSLDPKYRVNITVGMRVMIKEDDNPDLAPCHVKEIITKDHMHELGIKVSCENGRVGRVRHIGTETAYMSSMDLITILETKLRGLIVEELSRNDPEWWENKIHPKIRDDVAEKRRGKQVPQMPKYDLIEEIYFSDLHTIILSKKNWKNHFEKIFHDKDALKVKLSELLSCRNALAHSKEPTDHMESKIRVYYDDIMPLIEEYHRRLREPE